MSFISSAPVVGVIGYTNAINTSAPNDVIPVSSFIALGLAVDIDSAVGGKGAGAILGQIPNNAISGGNKRGANAVDFQTVREIATQVAAGLANVIGGGGSNATSSVYSAIAGGFRNVAGGYAFVGGGSTNTASGFNSVVSGGDTNTASNTYSTISGGSGNQASGSYSYVGAGVNNTASGSLSFIGSGNTNISSGLSSGVSSGNNNSAIGDYSNIAGGRSNTVDAAYSAIPGGYQAVTRGVSGKLAFSGGRFAVNGDNQLGMSHSGVATINAAATVLLTTPGAASAASFETLPVNSSYAFDVLVTARSSGVDCASWSILGMIKKDGTIASTALVGVPVSTLLGATAGAAAWTATVVAEAATYGALQISVVGAAATNIHWGATVITSEVTY